MTEPRDRIGGSASGRESFESRRSRAAVALFAVGLGVVVASSALYFFGVGAFSEPAAPVLGLALGLALLAPLSLGSR
ncbi:hypothetical protein [Halorussus halobius]|uniref:hypothetical protein n=1 Tax=Halorussus halobius TaxID=1710537 RepID=UPI00109333CE|nr:hypothetical protein [Halorussus halobius]